MMQPQEIFTQNQYPFYSRYIYLVINMITNEELRVSSVDMDILSLALGTETSKFFEAVTQHTSPKERLNSLIEEGHRLKIAVDVQLKESCSEVSNSANKAVVDVIVGQYQQKIDEATRKKALQSDVQIERARQRKLIDECRAKQAQVEKMIQEQRLQKEKLRAIEDKKIAEQDKKERLEHKLRHTDFKDFGLFDVQKNSKLAKLLIQLRKQAITEEELKWLESTGFINDPIVNKNNLHLAQLHLANWQDRNKPWELVNASAVYRKLNMSKVIKPVLEDSYPFKFTNNNEKLKSALLTTYGGVCRDLGSNKQSIKLGHEAHKVTPLNFRPCTLLGAVHISTGEFSLGHEWYEKAKERGFSQGAYDNDIRSIYIRANKEMKKRIKQNLIQTGHKYDWLKSCG
jgi:hypothetical protein